MSLDQISLDLVVQVKVIVVEKRDKPLLAGLAVVTDFKGHIIAAVVGCVRSRKACAISEMSDANLVHLNGSGCFYNVSS